MLLTNNQKTINETNPQFAYRVLKENILNLRLRPGDLISETELAKALNISRTPIREAIINLKNESLVDSYPQKGTFVSLFDINLIEQAEFMRTVLEAEVIKLATVSFPKDKFKELEDNLKFQEKVSEFSVSPYEFFNLDNHFHEIIFHGCNKEDVWEQIKIISSHLNRIRLLDALERTSLNYTLQQHKEILALIKDKDSNAVDKVVKSHISNFHDHLEALHKKYPQFFKNR